MEKKKILITGAAGRISRVLREGLRDDYRLRLLYHNAILPARPDEEVHISSITDMDKVVEAVDGVDAVVHMAGNPNGNASFEDILEANIRGTYTVYEATRRTGVERVVFASSNHVTGYYEKNGIGTTTEVNARPDSFYGASKAYGEDLGRYYADAFGLSVICLRIGSFQPAESVLAQPPRYRSTREMQHRNRSSLRHLLRHIEQYPRILGPPKRPRGTRLRPRRRRRDVRLTPGGEAAVSSTGSLPISKIP